MTTKKRPRNADGSPKSTSKRDRTALFEDIKYEQYTLPEIYEHLENLCHQIPKVPENSFRLQGNKTNEKRPECLPPLLSPTPFDKKAIREWANKVDQIMDEVFPLASLTDTAVYRWKLDRSGAAEQNWATLKDEINTVLEHLNRTIATGLDEVLSPETTLLRDKTIKHISENKEEEENFFIKTLDDPDHGELQFTRFAHRAPLLRQLLIANLDKILQILYDYTTAQEKDNQHDARSSLY